VTERTPFICKYGFSAEIPEDVATQRAVKETIETKYTRTGQRVEVTGTSIIRTLEHQAEGEFLVRVEGVVIEDANEESAEAVT
jgi:hypothetical protein